MEGVSTMLTAIVVRAAVTIRDTVDTVRSARVGHQILTTVMAIEAGMRTVGVGYQIVDTIKTVVVAAVIAIAIARASSTFALLVFLERRGLISSKGFFDTESPAVILPANNR